MIPRPNLDLALNEVIRKRDVLRNALETAPESERPEMSIRIDSLSRWIEQRSEHPIVPPEYRPPFRRKRRPEPLGYKHPGHNPNFPFPKGR